MRRIFTIVAILVVLLGLGAFVYYYLTSQNTGITAEPGVTNPFDTGGENDVGLDMNGSGGEDPGTGTDDFSQPADEVTPRLLKITPGPVAVGALALDQANPATTTLGAPVVADRLANVEVRYVMRASGNIFSYDADDKRSTRLSNKTVPGIQYAAWLPDGTTAFLRYLVRDPDESEHIETYSLSSDGLTGTYLARDVASVDTAGAKLFTLIETTGGTAASVSNADGSAASVAFTSPIIGLRASYMGAAEYLAHTKPSRELPGYAFSVSGGVFTRLLGPLPGLSVISDATGSRVLYSYADGSSMRLASVTRKDGVSTSLPVQTLVEKCAFSPDGLFAYCGVPSVLTSNALPDTWYQGTVAFTDRIWKIDFAARVATVVADLPELTKEPIDAIGLTLNPMGTALVFTNRRDGALWLFAL